MRILGWVIVGHIAMFVCFMWLGSGLPLLHYTARVGLLRLMIRKPIIQRFSVWCSA